MFNPLLFRFRGTSGSGGALSGVGGDQVFDFEDSGQWYRTHVFTNTTSQTLTFETLPGSSDARTLDVFLVGGGGGGGYSENDWINPSGGGGGGAGGLLSDTHVLNTKNLRIYVGAGGANGARGADGVESKLVNLDSGSSIFVALGGGGGGAGSGVNAAYLEEQTIGTTDTTLAATAALVGAEVGLGQEERLLSQYRHMEALEIVDIMVKVKAIRANQQ